MFKNRYDHHDNDDEEDHNYHDEDDHNYHFGWDNIQ